jgi:hypothetical protein
MTNGPITWITAILTGAATVLGVETLFRTVDHAQIVPLAQACGFVAAWAIAWPYARTRYNVKAGFIWYTFAAIAPSFMVAALRIALRTG